MIGVLRRGEEAHGCSGVPGVRASPPRRRTSPRRRQCGGELDSLNQRPGGQHSGPGGSPAAAPFLEPRRRESPRGAAVRLRLQFCSPKCASETRRGLPCQSSRGAGGRAGRGPRYTSQGPKTALQLQISVSSCLSGPSFSFSATNSRRCAGGARPSAGHARCSVARRGGRAGQPVAAAAAPPGGRGSLSLLHLQDGRRRLHPDAQAARPPEPRFTRLRGYWVDRLGLRPRRSRTLFAARPSRR